MYVRNAMEDFHVEHLSDPEMKILNPIIRQALYEIVGIIEDDLDTPKGQVILGQLMAGIPEYWELPKDHPLYESDEELRWYERHAA